MIYRIGFSLCLLFAFVPVFGAKPSPTLQDVAYGPDERNVMDVWLVESAQPVPAVINIHGGGWLQGDKSQIVVPGAPQSLLDEGIAFISINYRYLKQTTIDTGSTRGTGPIQPRGDYPEAPVSVPLGDCARALQFVRAHAAEWGIDPERIAVTGGSAGACTSLWLAFHDDLADPDAEDPIARESTKPFCAATAGAQTTLDPDQILEWIPNNTYGGHAFGFIWDFSDHTVEIRSFQAGREEIEPWIQEYSPYHLADANDPPVYLYYHNGDPGKGNEPKDPVHSSTYGLLLAERLDELGVEHEFVYQGLENPRHASLHEYLVAKLKQD